MAETPIRIRVNNTFKNMLCAGVMALAMGVCASQPAAAQQPGAKRTLSGEAVVLDPATLLVRGYEVKLWGAQPAGGEGSIIALKGRQELEDIIGDAKVNCTVQQVISQRRISALCGGGVEDDLAVAMIRRGYASVDRRETAGSSFAELYNNTETTAMNQNAGIWRGHKDEPGAFDKYMPMITAFGPLAGLLILAIVVGMGIRGVRRVQEKQLAEGKRREQEIEGRERQVLATAMESEMEETRGKVEAFITIYQELLETVRSATAQNAHAGEIVHKRPSIIRSAFDTNVDKLQVLGIKVSGDLSQFYGAYKDEPEYWTLEANTPSDEAVKMVRTAIQNAEKMLPQIDKITAELRVIRSGKG